MDTTPRISKCNNIILDDNHGLYIIDLGGGLTEGMYRPESEWKILQGQMTASDVLYTFGRTVWGLWDSDFVGDEKEPGE